MLTLALVYFPYFEGHGWFSDKVTSFDGEYYEVIYEDGDSEECNDQEMEDIALTPDLASVGVGSRVSVLLVLRRSLLRRHSRTRAKEMNPCI
jgi:hypothetical protein